MWMVLTSLLYAFLILSGQSASASGRLAPVNPSVEEHLFPAIQHKQPQAERIAYHDFDLWRWLPLEHSKVHDLKESVLLLTLSLASRTRSLSLLILSCSLSIWRMIWLTCSLWDLCMSLNARCCNRFCSFRPLWRCSRISFFNLCTI